MTKRLPIILAIASTLTMTAFAADHEAKVNDRLAASVETLNEMMHAADKGIPQDLLDKARCVVVIPGMKKAGFIIGAKYGSGFGVCRKTGGWTAPAAMRVEGGSVGFQIGASETDVILLVMNESGMRHLLEDKFTLGGNASVAAGPLGRTAQAETDAAMHAEMLAYSRARGLFAGISLEGATLRGDMDANQELYGREMHNREILSGTVATPPAAAGFERALNRESPVRQ
jgi:lipid-binding SYLF domain-containing protein